ncbi:hypothetical protein Hanom_Chr10g00933161 [Helianthus anomalus]
MELTSQMKMARFHTFWIQMRKKKKPLDECGKTSQTSRMKIAFYSLLNLPTLSLQVKENAVGDYPLWVRPS